MKYTVDIREVWIRAFEVEAESAEEAKEKANMLIESGEEELSLDYVDTLDPETWLVYNHTKNQYE